MLPLWLVVGWAIFNAASQPWALLPVLLVFAPSVMVGQLVAALMVRVRPSVRASRAVSWLDVAVFGAWHVLTILVGLYRESSFAITLILAVLAFIGVLWATGAQLWRESTGARLPVVQVPLRGAAGFGGAFGQPTATAAPESPAVVVVEERTQRREDIAGS